MRLIGQSFCLLVLLGGLASATTVNCTVVSGPTELSNSIVCPQFSGVGLQSVQITVSGDITGSIMLMNNATTTESTQGTTSSDFSIGPLAGFSFGAPIFTAMYTTGPQSLTAGQSQTFSGLKGSGMKDLGTDTAVLAPYMGAGSFTIDVSTLTSLVITGGGGHIGSSQSTSADATAVVTYTAGTSTPEPLTASLIGLGLCGLGLLQAKKFRS